MVNKQKITDFQHGLRRLDSTVALLRFSSFPQPPKNMALRRKRSFVASSSADLNNIHRTKHGKKSPSSIKPTRHKQTNKQTCICSHDMCYPLLPRNKSSVSFYTSFCCGGKRKKERKKNHPEKLIVRPVLAFGVTDHSRSRGLDV